MSRRNFNFNEYPPQYNDIKDVFLPLSLFKRLSQENSLEDKGNSKISTDLNDLSKDTVIIYPPTIDWHWMKQRPQQLMEQFARHGFEVYFCSLKQSENISNTLIEPNLYLVHDNKKFITDTIPSLKRKGKRILIWVSWSKLCIFLEQYRPDFIIYDYLDDFAHWALYLDIMVNRADMVVATSGILKRQIEKKYPYKPNYLIPNGCDIRHFQKFRNETPEKPKEFSNHNGPIICYVGAWASWVDHELVKKIARTYPHALLVTLGVEFSPRVDNRFITNIKHLGHIPYDDLPRYLYYADICIIPFKINDITLATNPIKMYEYLAAGKPVVSSNLPEARNIPYVSIGKDHRSFIQQVGNNLSHSVRFDIKEVNNWLMQHTWECRYESIVQAVSCNLKNK
ncbi:putative teichuronic acid biosynthesis glycosyltransferase TuaH [Oxobacter pfennigii]|uniref:Putative teichuronic acid biosynthesis glycosyltransferase TuaH n=1 Tax=Oxobacter pfennigii TaxID=36849 RepID=A0A0P8YUP7_9CLOT|nr:glycosyltransferase [Oxobacter pfennigii]KPU43420.1 putative teichuronic acid biosynthesis glycosyltransferase TuaH [Oxobacter pfennigii]